jgi:TRAP transporter TAXI family solute receptor
MGRDALSWWAGLATLPTRAVLLALAMAWPADASRAQDMNYISLGTGAVNGVYYPVGRAMCRLFNRDAGPAIGRCGVESTPGSVYNLTKLRTGELDFAIVQSDTVSDAVEGLGPFRGDPQRWLRAVASLHPEVITLVARAGADIGSLAGLKRKRLNIGVLGSGSRTTWTALQDATGWAPGDSPVLSELKPDVALTALCSNQLDAVLLLVGHPSAVVRKYLDACDTKVVPVEGSVVESLLGRSRQYQRGTIPAESYGLPGDVPSLGVRAILMTSASEPDEVVQAMTTVVIKNLEELRRSHPALGGLDPEQMMTQALTAPLHPGALKAFEAFKAGQ